MEDQILIQIMKKQYSQLSKNKVIKEEKKSEKILSYHIDKTISKIISNLKPYYFTICKKDIEWINENTSINIINTKRVFQFEHYHQPSKLIEEINKMDQCFERNKPNLEKIENFMKEQLLKIEKEYDLNERRCINQYLSNNKDLVNHFDKTLFNCIENAYIKKYKTGNRVLLSSLREFYKIYKMNIDQTYKFSEYEKICQIDLGDLVIEYILSKGTGNITEEIIEKKQKELERIRDKGYQLYINENNKNDNDCNANIEDLDISNMSVIDIMKRIRKLF